jgi:hypothetical protein
MYSPTFLPSPNLFRPLYIPISIRYSKGLVKEAPDTVFWPFLHGLGNVCGGAWGIASGEPVHAPGQRLRGLILHDCMLSRLLLPRIVTARGAVVFLRWRLQGSERWQRYLHRAPGPRFSGCGSLRITTPGGVVCV